MTRVGIISDTHGHADLTRPAVRMLESLEVDVVLHCGDIGSAAVVEMFSAWPTHFVLGNCDWNAEELQTAIERVGQTFHGQFGDLEIDGVRIALLHSHDRRKFRECVETGQWQVVCYGHTHVAVVEHHGGTLLVNPGAIYRASPHSVAVLELPTCEATIVEL
jgi:putative phosphoesterase